MERFYPLYYNERRPQPAGLLSQLSYGGPSFDVTLSSDDLSGDAHNAANATVVIIRPGFATHGMNMGQRYVQLDSTYTAYEANASAILHVSQLPPNPAILAPGPALLFVVVNGVPSVGVLIMVGSGIIGTQDVLPIGDLPATQFVAAPAASSGGASSTGGSDQAKNAAVGGRSGLPFDLGLGLGLGLGLALSARTLLGI